IFWGDLRNPEDVYQAVQDREVIIHLGAIIPPLANEKPELSQMVNYGGTLNILQACQAQDNPPKLIFSSSVAIYGDVRHLEDKLLKTSQPFNPSPHDHYARQKIACEKLISQSDLEWAIFRLAAIGTLKLNVDPLMFEVPLDTRLEYAHTKDTGLALAKAVTTEEVWGNIFHLGGGPDSRVTYKEYVNRLLEAIGVGTLPDEAFGDKPFHCGYMDTKRSQALLNYQKHTFNDYVQEIKNRYQFIRFFIKLFRPIIRSYLLRKSPYYNDYRQKTKDYLQSKRLKTKKIKPEDKKKPINKKKIIKKNIQKT
ncbi:MAG: NAD(P)-dependent oxidoreductase, partial [Asgard group archaeon]|nr:NAD(P)-dependent oxidoreductase [Asgard group archaeon]